MIARLVLLIVVCCSFSASAEDCRTCHEAQWQAWSSSRHAVAASNDIFQADFKTTPRLWCLQCHAPGVSIARVRFGVVDERHGVRCETCHRVDATILSAREPSAKARAAHKIQRDERLADERLCVRCHQFNFPGTTTAMQDTVREWRASGSPVSCKGCHEPHRAPGAHDRALLSKSLAVEVVRDGERVLASLRSLRAAHASPTGDLTRAISVELCVDASCTQVTKVLAFERRFRELDAGYALVRDTRPQAGQTRVLEVNDPSARFFRARFLYAPQLLGVLDDATVSYVLDQGPITAP